MATSPRFEETAGGAAVGNPKLVRRNSADADAQPGGFYGGGTPPKASDAPKPSAANVFTGLCEALNSWQQDLVKKGTYEKADEYEIQFIPPAMADAQLKKPGGINQSKTPMQLATTAKLQLDKDTNSMNVTGRTISVQAGTQIIQFIDQVIRSSSYIADQQLYQVDENTQEVTKNPSGNDRPVAWYKISVQVIDLGPDRKRNDHAYRMVYFVTPYGINETRSPYFPKTSFRGVQKAYDYWFTGNNTAILNYEQDINFLYHNVITETLPLVNNAETNPDVLTRRSWQTRSDQSSQYAEGATNEPAANLADFLMSQDDFAEINLKIVGDPAWIPQGEISGGVNENNFSFAAFNSDDGINYEAQEVAFSVTFNQPEDYNLDTGLMEVASNFKKQDGEFGRNYPKKSQTYRAYEVTSTFSKGRFEQDIRGTLYMDILKQETESRIQNQRAESQVREANRVITEAAEFGNRGSLSAAEFGGIDAILMATGGAVSPTSNSTVPPNENKDKNTQPLTKTAPTSNGGVSGAEILNGAPPPPITIRPTTPRLDPNATGQTLVPQPTPPQYGNREA
jgi:hypothetical protein